MDKICAIVDCQGFQLSNRFIAREVAIASDTITQCQELNPNITWHEFTDQEKETIKFTTHNINGLFYKPFNNQKFCYLFKSNEIGNILIPWYQMVSTEAKPCFAIKNQQMELILRNLDIPYINLDDPQLNFPSYKEISYKYGENYLCSFHKKLKTDLPLTCAYRKVAQLYREFKSRDILIS